MTGPVAAASAALLAALKAVPAATATADPGSEQQLPALYVGAPQLAWETGDSAPTTAIYIVIAVVDADERAIERLWDLSTAVAEAVDMRLPNAAVTSAGPGTFVLGATQLPCYNITIEVGL